MLVQLNCVMRRERRIARSTNCSTIGWMPWRQALSFLGNSPTRFTSCPISTATVRRAPIQCRCLAVCHVETNDFGRSAGGLDCRCALCSGLLVSDEVYDDVIVTGESCSNGPADAAAATSHQSPLGHTRQPSTGTRGGKESFLFVPKKPGSKLRAPTPVKGVRPPVIDIHYWNRFSVLFDTTRFTLASREMIWPCQNVPTAAMSVGALKNLRKLPAPSR